MEKKKGTSPATVAVLAVATGLAVALATWSVKRALAPPPTAPVAPGDQASGAAPGAPNGSATIVAAGGVEIYPAVDGEAALAPGADPFVQLPVPGQPQAPRLPALPPLGGGIQTAVARTAGWRGVPSLPPISPFPAVPAVVSGTPAPTVGPAVAPPAPPPEPEPELIGTLTGERASAVFRSDKRLLIIPISQRIGSWEVISVDHGSALLRSGSRVVRVNVGGRRLPGITETSEQAPRPVEAVPISPQPTRHRPRPNMSEGTTRVPVAVAERPAPRMGGVASPAIAMSPTARPLLSGPAPDAPVHLAEAPERPALAALAAGAGQPAPPKVRFRPVLSETGAERGVVLAARPANPVPPAQAPARDAEPVALPPQMASQPHEGEEAPPDDGKPGDDGVDIATDY